MRGHSLFYKGFLEKEDFVKVQKTVTLKWLPETHAIQSDYPNAEAS